VKLFHLYLTEDIISIIIRETNWEAERCYKEWNNANLSNQKKRIPVNWIEIDAFLGLLLLAGVYHARQEALHELWSRHSDRPRDRPIFLATMSVNHFKLLLRFCRFDNKVTHVQRRATDKLAAFRDVWTMFVAQLRKFYIPGTDLTVNEQLVPLRGCGPFRQYIPSKPAKYGVKAWWCCDGAKWYPPNAEVYLGKQPAQEREVIQGERVVTTMVSPWYSSGCNMVGDNFFISVALVEELRQ